MDQRLNLTKLKIKAKSLAEEARIIRREESRFSGWQRASLNEHRRSVVRDAARATYLAIALIKGVPYRVLEATCELNYRMLYIDPKVLAMVQKYHDRTFTKEQLTEWFKGSTNFQVGNGNRSQLKPVLQDQLNVADLCV